MDSITVKNFRCFGEEQTARLAPLTLLVGDNSTGKTSFLALIRAMWDVAYDNAIPNFRERPYDFGSFEETTHQPNDNRIDSGPFVAGFTTSFGRQTEFDATFQDIGGSTYPSRRKVARGDAWIELHQKRPNEGQDSVLRYGANGDCHEVDLTEFSSEFDPTLMTLYHATLQASFGGANDRGALLVLDRVRNILREAFLTGFAHVEARPYASSPTRSRPARTYDPIPPAHDPEGLIAPTTLARTSARGGYEWEELRNELVDFGTMSGLFDDIKILHMGSSEGSPFQILVRKRGTRRPGPFRNLIDMGYGISQVLPILTELMRPDGPQMFLLQQPEVHLHPSAQAALGTLFCSMAAAGKQIIVETHSDNIIDRVRMDVRDGTTDLNADDVSILFFERRERDVKIHSLGIDENGEIFGAPLGYRQFFMDEVNRSIGFIPLEE